MRFHLQFLARPVVEFVREEAWCNACRTPNDQNVQQDRRNGWPTRVSLNVQLILWCVIHESLLIKIRLRITGESDNS